MKTYHRLRLHRQRETIVIFRNLPLGTGPTEFKIRAARSLRVDATMRTRDSCDWRGDEARENFVLNALFTQMGRGKNAICKVFEAIKQQALSSLPPRFG